MTFEELEIGETFVLLTCEQDKTDCFIKNKECRKKSWGFAIFDGRKYLVDPIEKVKLVRK